MNGFDYFLIALLVIAVGVETWRGFGMSVLDVVGVYAAYILIALVAPNVATHLPNIGGTGANYTDVYIGSFVFLAILFLVGAHFGSNMLTWDIGVFDKVGGSLLGLVLGVVFCHALVSGLSSGDPDQTNDISGPVSQQVLTFSTFYQMVGDIHKLVDPKPDQQ